MSEFSPHLPGLSGAALILGASSGFGAATALALARSGLDIYGVHLDRKATLPLAEAVQDEIRALGRTATFFNVNAADPERRAEVVEQIASERGPGGLRVLMHSLAFGTLRPYVSPGGGPVVSAKQMDMTLDVMAHSLVYWAQALAERDLFAQGGRVFAMTSEGSTRVWPSYGPVSAAKSALESHIRQLAVELAPLGVTANAILAGVTDTPALRKIPGNEEMIEAVLAKAPGGRLTVPEDVAGAICALTHEGCRWISGNTLRVDGGEHLAG